MDVCAQESGPFDGTPHCPYKGDEYTVNLKIREKESPLLEINLNVVSRDQAVYICDHWEKKHSDVYSMLIEKLLFDEPNK